MRKTLISILVAAFLALGENHLFASEEEEQWQELEAESSGMPQVKINGVPTQWPYMYAYFASLTSIDLPPLMISSDALDWMTIVSACMESHPVHGGYWSGLPLQQKQLIKRILEVYLKFYEDTYGTVPPVLRDPNLNFCGQRLAASLEEKGTTSATKFSRGFQVTIDFVGVDDYDSRIRQALDDIDSGSRTIDDVYLSWVYWQYATLFKTGPNSNPALWASLPLNQRPENLFKRSTTPDLAHAQTLAHIRFTQVPWDALGLPKEQGFGFSTISSFFAQMSYSHPILTSFIPVIGTAMGVLDAWETLREERTANGAPISSVQAGGILAVNLAFAMFEISAIRTAANVSISTFNSLRARARNLAISAQEISLQAAVNQFKSVLDNLIVSGVSLGSRSRQAFNALGKAPKYIFESLWMESLGFAAAQSEAYARKMVRGSLKVPVRSRQQSRMVIC